MVRFIDTGRCVHFCPLCPDKEFINRGALEEHLRNSYRHGWCEACQRLCHSRYGLSMHLRAVHKYAIPSTASAFYEKAKAVSNPTDHHKPPSPATSASVTNRSAKSNIICFGCDRPFHSHASMMLHLEEGHCITTMAELGLIAEETDYSDSYIAFGWREYLRTEYGHGNLAIDTDHETIWECVECRKGFFSLKQAKQHARSPAHKPLVFKCPGCDMCFSALSGVLQHVEMSGVCGEGLHNGSGVMGRLLVAIEERFKGKAKFRPRGSYADSQSS